MGSFISLFFGFIARLLDVLDSASVDLLGVPVPIGQMILGFIVIYIVCAVFWKGASG